MERGVDVQRGKYRLIRFTEEEELMRRAEYPEGEGDNSGPGWDKP